jgi:hypothetical protein
MIQTAGRHENRIAVQSLEHAEHDSADKGECDIRGNNAQFADEAHGKSPWFTSLPVVTLKANRAFHPEKVSFAVHLEMSTAGNRAQRG